MDTTVSLLSMLFILIYLAIPIGAVALLVYFFRQRQKEKKAEEKKDYSEY